ncbi:MAG TPA: YciI family protein [Galbitalea sp.]|jgi:hypothetical protein
MQYLVSVIDDGQAEAAQMTESASAAEMAAIDLFNDKLIAEGYWVFAGGLGAPSSGTVIDSRGAGAPVITDGPFLESKEFIAGLWLWEVPNLDVALKLAAEGSKACNRKLEVRPLLAG